jgi:lipopolysaccharide biosynthesis regulator YciM
VSLELDWTWLLLALPIVFALGWIAARFDLRQWKRESRESPRAIYQGLNLLLNEQPDKAIDAFIVAVQNDPETAELHFALGNLFRRRGEFERAVRVHEHLLQRADLGASDRARAQHALAQDYAKAGLFDRAEAAFRALEGTAFESEARLALLGLYERTRDWRSAIDVSQRLERAGTGSFASRIAHFWCELALEADRNQRPDEGDAAVRKAQEASPSSIRPWVLAGQRDAAAGRHAQAVTAWLHVLHLQPGAAGLVAHDLVKSATHAGREREALDALHALPMPGADVASATATLLREGADDRAQRLVQQLALAPTLGNATAVLKAVPPASWSAATRDVLTHAVERAATPLQRYRCAACGFEAHHWFWQCPGCLSWDSFPPQRVEEL